LSLTGLIPRLLRVGALALLAFSETLILQWMRLAIGLPLLSGPEATVAFGIVSLVNLGLLTALRRAAHGRPALKPLNRGFLLASLGALFSGGALMAGLAGVGLPLWLLEGVVATPATHDQLLIGGGGAALALGFGSILWGWAVGQRRLDVERIPVPVAGLPAPLAGLRIAHITDLHIGETLRADALARFIDQVNALEPDLIAITGDIFDNDPAFIDEGCAELAQLRARHGVFAVLGNHDVYTGADSVAAGLRRHGGIDLLRDRVRHVAVGRGELFLLGVDDPGRGWSYTHNAALPGLVDKTPAGAVRILLVHRPSYFGQAADLGIEVTLAGHTHGGQVSLPGPVNQHNITRFVTRWTRGAYRRDKSFLYVNRGLGVGGLPIRLNCTREIALLELRPAAGDSSIASAPAAAN